jgi:hypothetical protein
MKMTTQLSVSSVILAAVLSGCSQQQVIGGSQVSGGSQQHVDGGSQVTGSQQQVEAAPAVIQPKAMPAPKKRAPVRVYQKPQRVYTRGPKPRMSHSVKRSGLGLPPAKPGQCFAKVKVPAKYQTKSKRILIQKASSSRVLVRAPQYRWTNKKVLVRKATYRNRVIPAQYRNKTRRVLVKPAYNTWRKGHGAITRIDNMTGQIMCRVTVPAVYKTVSQRVLVRKVQNIRTFVPAVYKTVKQKQRVSAALYKTVHRPARYKTQNYRVKVAGARYVWKPVLCQTNAPKNYRKAVVQRKPVVRTQAKYKKQYKRSSGITRQQYLQVMNASLPARKKPAVKKAVVKKPEIKKPEMVEPVVAPAKEAAVKKPAKVNKAEKPSKTAIKQNIVYGIQAALKTKGFNPGKLDGKMGPTTAAALKAFQSSRGLPVGVLSKDTFRALGLVR